MEKEKEKEVTYVCAATGKQETGKPGELPTGWIIPPRDVSRDIDKEPLPHGTVLALSSEQAWKQYWNNLVNSIVNR
jgi:hypothetical protein